MLSFAIKISKRFPPVSQVTKKKCSEGVKIPSPAFKISKILTLVSQVKKNVAFIFSDLKIDKYRLQFLRLVKLVSEIQN